MEQIDHQEHDGILQSVNDNEWQKWKVDKFMAGKGCIMEFFYLRNFWDIKADVTSLHDQRLRFVYYRYNLQMKAFGCPIWKFVAISKVLIFDYLPIFWSNFQ